jgi:septal ring factor EnvC (AmiA/AmiB activator)
MEKTFKSQKQKDSETKELIKAQENKINILKDALQRIANTYDNVEDLAGVIARQTLDRLK